MSYKKMVVGEAQSFIDNLGDEYEQDSGEFGGKSDAPNLSRWLDRTRKLFEHVDAIADQWTKAEIEMVRSSSRNAVSYGAPKETAYFAFYKDALAQVKKRYRSPA